MNRSSPMSAVSEFFHQLNREFCERQKPRMIECIEWFETAKQLPDEDLTVMACVEGFSEVLLASLDAGKWYYESGFPISAEVKYWAEIPEGPKDLIAPK